MTPLNPVEMVNQNCLESRTSFLDGLRDCINQEIAKAALNDYPSILLNLEPFTHWATKDMLNSLVDEFKECGYVMIPMDNPLLYNVSGWNCNDRRYKDIVKCSKEFLKGSKCQS